MLAPCRAEDGDFRFDISRNPANRCVGNLSDDGLDLDRAVRAVEDKHHLEVCADHVDVCRPMVGGIDHHAVTVDRRDCWHGNDKPIRWVFASYN